MSRIDIEFSGSIPEFYHSRLVPMLFEPYAKDLVKRISLTGNSSVLETAAGTGILTKYLIECLPTGAKLVATDINPDMLEVAQKSVSGNVHWQVADAMELPFEDNSYDKVICQFGVMFFPEKVQGYREAKRVLKEGGEFVFNVWQDISKNPTVKLAYDTLCNKFPNDPPEFMNIPFGYFNKDVISDDLRNGGFKEINFYEVNLTSGEFSIDYYSAGIIKGSPMLTYVKDMGEDVEEISKILADAFKQHFGGENMKVDLSAIVVSAI
jgi:ubiquinone/menaquinone biosynthesis C-methylase UbiE